MLIVAAEVGGRPGLDVRVDGERIVEVGAGLERRMGDEVIEAGGAAVIPALHDHHVHLRAMAAAWGSVPAGPPGVTDAAALTTALRRAARATPGGGWVRAVGYHESVAGPLDRHRLDAMVADRPVRVQHRSGALWLLNGLALDAIGATGTDEPGVERDGTGAPTGRLWRLDRWLARAVPPAPVDIGAVSRLAAARGVAGFTDADPRRTRADIDLLVTAARRGELLQHVMLMSSDGHDLGPPFVAGPRKLLLDDATLPAVDEIAAWLADAHDRNRPVAVHCVTRLQLVATLAALADAGSRPGDRIEHAGVVPPPLRSEMRRLGVAVVTQPNFVAERGDQYLADVEPDDIPVLYPCASLRAAGVAVAGGTDAPFGDADPWAAMRAAVHRRTRDGRVLGADERVGPDAALDLFLGSAETPAEPRRVEPGGAADLCVLDRPLASLHAALAAGTALDPVAVTVAGGRVIADNR